MQKYHYVIDFTFFFRACIWWKYLDEDSVLPPPYTAFYFMIMGVQKFSHYIALKLSSLQTSSEDSQNSKNTANQSPIQRREAEQQQLIEVNKQEFHKR